MATVDDLLSAFPASAPAGAAPSKAKDLLDAFNAPASPPAPAPEGFWATMGHKMSDGANAVATGFNRSLVGLAGLPTDTLANVVDLGKAAAGSAYIAATGKDIPSYLEPLDRKKYVGTSDYILNKLNAAPPAVSGFVNAQNPEYQGGYLQNVGGALAAATMPYKSLPQMAQGILTNQAGAAASKAAYDVTGSPSAAIIGNLIPTAAANVTAGAMKYAARGGASPQAVAQRVQDLENAGITQPTVGLATGNKTVGGIENILASTPGAMGVMAKSRNNALAGLQGTVSNAADLAAPDSLRGARATGIAINKGIDQFNTDFKAQQGALYDNLDKFVPGSTPVEVGNTKSALDSLTATIPGATQTSRAFINGKIGSIKQGFDVDTGAVPNGQTTTTTVPVLGAPSMRTNGMGLQVPAVPTRIDGMGLKVPAGPLLGTRTDVIPPRSGGAFSGLGVPDNSPPTLPFQAVKQLRTSVGAELSDNTLVPSVPNRQWKSLYGALSGDIQGAANAAGPQATSVFNRANDYTRAGLSRLETVQGFQSEPTSPEQSFNAAKSTLGDNASLFNTLKKSLPQGARGQIAGTVIDQLGTSTPGQQNDTGSAWSPERFLTNWNRMSPDARSGLLSGFENSDQVAGDINAVAKATSMMRDNSGMWANPSGTAAASAARATFGAPVIAAATGHPMIAAGAAGLLGASNLAARGLTSKWAVDALKNKTEISPEEMRAAMQNLAFRGLLVPDQPGNQ